MMAGDNRPSADAPVSRDVVGAVVIGRNEGPRLDRCLPSVLRGAAAVVYADSGSSDGSPERARRCGCDVVELDPSQPLSAARARNEGFARLRKLRPDIPYVQFVDGDCEIEAGWLEGAWRELEARGEAAVVFGGLRERERESSIYNRLCDLEWRCRPGEVIACGGIFMVRVEAFERVGGFDPKMIAGEESEFCLRLCRAGWKIVRLPHPMAIHEAGITRFSQWWKRAVRTGYGYAQGLSVRTLSERKVHVREVLSSLGWGLLAPAALLSALVLAPWVPWSVWIVPAVLLLLGALAYRIRRSLRSLGAGPGDATLYALFCILSKLPMALGMLKFLLARVRGARPSIIEYKTDPPAEPTRTDGPR